MGVRDLLRPDEIIQESPIRMSIFQKQLDSYETKGERPIAWARFVDRMVKHGIIAGVLILMSLAMGMVGYRGFEGLGWLDAFLNASMILGGMGPVDTVKSSGGKLFAGMYALYSGLVFLVVAGLLLTPVVHRVLHRFHAEIADSETGESPGKRKKSK